MRAPASRLDVASAYLLAGVGLWLSYIALADLARRSGIGEHQAYAWPLIIDGLILLATRAVFTAQDHNGARRYAWFLLLFGAAISIVGNAVHMLLPTGPVHPAIAVGVGIAPPVVTLLVTHLVMVRARVRRTQLAAAAAPETPHPDAAPAPQDAAPETAALRLTTPLQETAPLPVINIDAAPAAPDDPLPHPVDEPAAVRHPQASDPAAPGIDAPAPIQLRPLPTPATHFGQDYRAKAIDLLAAGMSARAVGRELGVSDRTVRRWKTEHDTATLAAS
ncbi:Protein of uncharacterised function (DUF2637) [Mycobacteroides abscessus subsp. abscessus]|nr:Protein of uncharacterised function (DUF2637) [Mycobacteroides abscessus subsp. abscessus]